MTQLPPTNLALAIVGQQIPISWANNQAPATLRQMQYEILDSISIYNESGCGMKIQMNNTARNFTLPAGGWTNEPIPVSYRGTNDTGYVATIQYILSSPQVSLLFTDYWLPGETPLKIASLGNSPIGGNVSVLSTPTIIVEPTTVFPITTTGSFVLGPFSIATTGLYEITSSFLVNNSGVATITEQVNYTEGFGGTSVTARSLSTSGGVTLNGAVLANNGVGVCAACFYIKGGTSVTVNFQDSTGTPNDQVVVGINKLF